MDIETQQGTLQNVLTTGPLQDGNKMTIWYNTTVLFLVIIILIYFLGKAHGKNEPKKSNF